MSIHARRCEGCGGPLPEAPADHHTITCEFCGVVNEISSTAPIIISAGSGTPVPQSGRSALAWILRIALTIGCIGLAFVIYRRLHPIPGPVDAVRLNALRPREAMRTITLRELPTLSERGYRQVDAPAPPGGWAAFDPVASVAWASEIARAWAPDARLTRIDLGVIAADGTADLTSDRQDVRYRFSSPARIAQWERVADRQVDASVPYELMLRVVQRQVSVYVHNGRPPAEALPPTMESLPLRDVLTRARKSGRFPDHPLYTGFLIYTERVGWVWAFQSLSRRDNVPLVRARDAAVYPWR